MKIALGFISAYDPQEIKTLSFIHYFSHHEADSCEEDGGSNDESDNATGFKWDPRPSWGDVKQFIDKRFAEFIETQPDNNDLSLGPIKMLQFKKKPDTVLYSFCNQRFHLY